MVLLMTMLMGLALSGIATVGEQGLGAGFLSAWGGRFVATYVVVLPVVLIVSPVARRLAIRLDRLLVGTAADE